MYRVSGLLPGEENMGPAKYAYGGYIITLTVKNKSSKLRANDLLCIWRIDMDKRAKRIREAQEKIERKEVMAYLRAATLIQRMGFGGSLTLLQLIVSLVSLDQKE